MTIEEALIEIRRYQTERLKATYADFSEKPEYTHLVTFFFTQIYGTQDFGFRNESIKTLHQRLKGVLKGEIIEAVGKVIELNDLTEMLDRQMAEAWLSRGGQPPLNDASYRDIYRSLNNYRHRVRQIELLVDATAAIHRISRSWWVGMSLKAVHTAAHLAGYGKIMDSLEAGYAAFHNIRDIKPFLEAVKSREIALNDRLFGVIAAE